MFGLERIQGAHNGVTTNSSNVSASNDPKQVPNDATDILLKGALKAAAGRELGLSEEETLAATSRAARRQKQRDEYKSRNQRLAEWEQKQKTLRDEGFDTGFVDSDLEEKGELAAAFGQDQGDYYEYQPDDRQYQGQQIEKLSEQLADMEDQDNKGRRRYERGQVRLKTGVNPAEYDDIADQLAQLKPERDDIAPKSALQEILSLIQGTSGRYGYDSISGLADVEDRLIRQVQGGVDLDRERFLAAELAQADAARFDPELRQYNDYRAEAESQAIAREYFGGYGSGSMADDAIGRIAEIRKLGGAGALAAGESAQVVRFNDDVSIDAPIVRDGVYFDPRTNNPIAVQGPETPPQFRGANTPNTAQTANAPQPQNAATWLRENLPSPREGGRVFNDYPQVDITLATTNFAQKLRELEGYGLGNVSENIRSADELQRVTDYIIKKAEAKGQPLYLKDEAGKNRRSANPGVAEVMQLLRMSDIEKQQLANALYQMETAQPSQTRETYQTRAGGPTKGVTFDAPEAIDGNMAATTDLARIPAGSTIAGPDGKRIGIRQALQSLESPGAQKPIIAQVQGEKPRVNRRKPGGMGSGNELAARIDLQARRRAKGKPVDEERLRGNIVKARLAEERENRDSRARADQMSEIIANLPPNARRTRIR